MKFQKSFTSPVTLLVALFLLAGSVPAQVVRRQQTAKPRGGDSAQPRTQVPPAPATQAAAPARQRAEREQPIESLLASDSYAVYVELRNVGQLIRNETLKQAIKGVMLMDDTPPEFGKLVEFVTQHQETLGDARLLVGLMPVRRNLPRALMALQMSSLENAAGFEPVFKGFFAKQLQGTRASNETHTVQNASAGTGTSAESGRGNRRRETTAPPPVSMKRTGSLILAAYEPFTLKNLRGDATQMLADNARFQSFRSRFASESLFVYFDSAMMTRGISLETERYQQEYEERERAQAQLRAGSASAASSNSPTLVLETAPPPPAPIPALGQPTPTPAEGEEKKDEAPVDETTGGLPTATLEPVVTVPTPDSTPESEVTLQPTAPVAKEAQEAQMMIGLLTRSLFDGIPQIPEAVGVGARLEGNSLQVRALFTTLPGVPVTIIPITSGLSAGPAISGESASVMPADTEIYASFSLNWSQIFNNMISSLESQSLPEATEQGEARTDAEKMGERQDARGRATSDLAKLEKLLGFKIRDDLLPALGNEVAVGFPVKWFDGSESRRGSVKSANEKESDAEQGFIVAIALNNPETMRRILPGLMLALGMRSPAAPGSVEKRAGYEINNGAVSYAILNNYAVFAEDVRALRYTVDRFAESQTLLTNSRFRDRTDWQPRQKLGQLYISPAMMENWLASIKGRMSVEEDPAILALEPLLNIQPESITFAATSESDVVVYEAHAPFDLLQMFSVEQIIWKKELPYRYNEARAMGALANLAQAQEAYKSTVGKGRYGTLDELFAAHLLSRYEMTHDEYRIELSVTGEKFQATATPRNYGKTGRISYFIDESRVLRGANHKGRTASVDDPSIY